MVNFKLAEVQQMKIANAKHNGISVILGLQIGQNMQEVRRSHLLNENLKNLQMEILITLHYHPVELRKLGFVTPLTNIGGSWSS